MKQFLANLAAIACYFAQPLQAAEVAVAVAANFTAPMQEIAAAFAKNSSHKITLAFGGTGKFFTQIKHGAPFQVLIAADAETPLRLEKENLGIPGTRFTYAVGKLVLWSHQPGFVDSKGDVLRTGTFPTLAIADPKLAPYGKAALEVLTHLDLMQRLQPRFVQGENIAQTYQFVATENAPLGFVALSQVFADGRITQGSAWIVPPELYRPIRQDALLLTAGKDNPAALALLDFLRSEKARYIMRAYGYDF